MLASRVAGLVLLAVGVALLMLGINATQSLEEEVREGLTGKYSSETLWYIVGGAAAIAGGAVLALTSGRIGKRS